MEVGARGCDGRERVSGSKEVDAALFEQYHMCIGGTRV